jgi:DUF2950 family protein
MMIGGFALVAAPAEYGVTGLKTFIVSQDGVVYEKDFGAKALEEFQKMERFSPDKSWSPVPEEDVQGRPRTSIDSVPSLVRCPSAFVDRCGSF